MPQINPGTANISTFGFSLNVDIYNRLFTFNLLPFTAGAGLGNTKVSFFVQDSDGVQLANIDFNTAGAWINPGTTTTWTLNLSSVVNFAFLFQTYQVYAAIQDAGGTVYQTAPIYPSLCQPNSLTDQGYIPGMFSIMSDCINSVLTVKEITLLVYNQLQPHSVTKTGTLNYPTGTVSPLSFATTPFTNNVVYTGQYNVQCTTVATYAIGNDVYVMVSYITNNNFPVTCANKLANVLCCITKVQQTAIRNCNNAIGENAKQQLSDISVYVMNGLLKEISGQDASFEVDYIKKYLSCDCGSDSLSQSEFTPINPAVTSIVLTGGGGTNIPSPTTTGNTQNYVITSNFYKVAKGNTGDLAFTIATDTSVANTVSYVITFNYDTMAGYILNAIATDPGLQSQLNSLVQAAGGLQGLNGRCVINTTETNYSLSQAITNATLITNIVINGTNYAAPSNLFANNPTSVATWLNSLSLGAFTAALNSGVLTILSTENTNVLSTLTFTSPNVVIQFQATNVTLVQVLQAIIDYLCGLTSLQIALGNTVSLCTLDYNNNVNTTTYGPTASQGLLNIGIGNALCNLANRINTLTGLTCAKLQSIFSDNVNASFNNASDRYLSIVGGACTTLTGLQQGMAFVNAMNAYPALKTAFCNISCSAPATCPGVAATNISALSQTSIGFYGVTWGVTPTANQVVTLMYRVTGTLTWTTASNSISLSPAGTISGTSPYTITGLTQGTTYDISVGNNCGGVAFVSQITTPSNTVYSGSFLLNNSLGSICAASSTTLYSSVPFATGVTMYTNSSLSTVVSGFAYIASASGGDIFNLNASTGVVGADTGSNCASGTAASYILGNSTASICAGTVVTRYTNGAFVVGGTLFLDSALTTPVTGNAYVVQVSTNAIYNLNISTGVVGSSTGLSCTVNVNLHDQTSVLSFTSVLINGAPISIPGGFPTSTGVNVTGTSPRNGTCTVEVSYSMTGPSMNCMTITGSDGTSQNQTIATGSSTVTFSGVVVNNTATVVINTTNGVCP